MTWGDPGVSEYLHAVEEYFLLAQVVPRRVQAPPGELVVEVSDLGYCRGGFGVDHPDVDALVEADPEFSLLQFLYPLFPLNLRLTEEVVVEE